MCIKLYEYNWKLGPPKHYSHSLLPSSPVRDCEEVPGILEAQCRHRIALLSINI
jgi:hypothetical protein